MHIVPPLGGLCIFIFLAYEDYCFSNNSCPNIIDCWHLVRFTPARCLYVFLEGFVVCLFPLPNYQFNSVSYKSGLREFKCGTCPECMKEKASSWALRGYMEAQSHLKNCMITLTYDNYARDSRGRIVGELPPNRDLHVNRRDIQLFFKRLRKWWSTQSDEPIKYIYTAEYGSTTHRAHYHAVIFGLDFPDAISYKKSKRGHSICTSAILSKLWGHGICTVDTSSVTASVVSYCTKYMAKSRSEDTFMGFSHGIGLEEMLKRFNGINYYVEGRVFPIPRLVWHHKIYEKYYRDYPYITYKYVNLTEKTWLSGEFQKNSENRSVFYAIKRSDPVYQKYLDYWKFFGEQYEKRRPSVKERLALLSEKFLKYRQEAYRVLQNKISGIEYIPPFSNRVSAHCHSIEHSLKNLGIKYISVFRRPKSELLNNCAFPSCYESANDTKISKIKYKRRLNLCIKSIRDSLIEIFDISPWDLQQKQLEIGEV